MITKELATIKVVKIDHFMKNELTKDFILNEIQLLKKLPQNINCVVKIHKMLKSANHIYISIKIKQFMNILNKILRTL